MKTLFRSYSFKARYKLALSSFASKVVFIVVQIIQSFNWFYCDFRYKDIQMSKKVTSAAKAPEPKKGAAFDPKAYAVNGVPEEEIVAAKQAFDLFDSDQGGSVDINELKAAMISLGFEAKNQAIFQMIVDLDTDGNGTIDFQEWVNLMTKRVTDRDSRANIAKVYALYDSGRNGYITAADVKRIAEEVGETVNEQEIAELIKRADVNGDGAVDEEEFYQIVTRPIKN